MEKYLVVSFLALFAIYSIDSAEGATIKQTMEGSVDVTITYPDKSFTGRTSSISVLIQNNGWEDKIISLNVTNQSDSIILLSEQNIPMGRISQGGTFGVSIDYKVSDKTTLGTHFLNLKYSQVLVTDKESPHTRNIAVPLEIHDKPKVNIVTNTPESIFTNAEFPFEVRVIPHDRDIYDVSVDITTPTEMGFRGETRHTYSIIRHEEPVLISSTIITPKKEIGNEQNIPFQVKITYTDDLGKENIDSKVIQLLLRPRTFLELTSDGGIWLGDFFVAPYVSVGTIVGIPIGIIISVLVRRSQKKRESQTSSNHKQDLYSFF